MLGIGFGTIASSLQATTSNLFKTFSYTGTGASNSITTPGFQPDLVAAFRKDGTTPSWPTFDSARGVGNYLDLPLISTTSDAQSLTAFNASGFSLGTSTAVNASTKAYQFFCWAKSSGYLDIKTYTGTAANRTVAHSLGAVPQMIIGKSYSGADLNQTFLYHAYLDGTSPGTYNIILNNGTVGRGNSPTFYNNTAPTSSVFSLGTGRTTNSTTGGTTNYVAYLFGASSGKSAFGTYTGNGSTSGPSVSLGFQPSMVMIVQQVASGNNIWWIYNSSKNGEINIDTTTEDTTNYVNLTGTGFTIVTTNADFNTNATTYVYSAWA